MKNESDTIVAIATPPGRGGVGIVRVSGSNSRLIGEKFFKAKSLSFEHGKMFFGKYSGSVEDTGYLVFFKSPFSYTGEDTVEFHLHGSPFILKSVISDIVESGLARLAGPGEFTKRALFNGKVNLIEAEAINTVISAENSYQAKVLSSLSGKLSDYILSLKSKLVSSIAFLEAQIEYPEEEETENALNDTIPLVEESVNSLKKALNYYEKSRFLFRGVKVVIAGNPNVGKSSLLNAIAGFERAIVTDIPGTTTDSIEVEIEFDGINFVFVDTAGIRKSEGKIEKLGIEKTYKQLEEADLILYLFDPLQLSAEKENFNLPEGFDKFTDKVLKVLNKVDLKDIPYFEGIKISAKENRGIDGLLNKIGSYFKNRDISENFLFSDRQYFALKEALSILEDFLDYAKGDFFPEVGASFLSHAIEVLEGVVGEITTDDILDSVFGNFCLGK